MVSQHRRVAVFGGDLEPAGVFAGSLRRDDHGTEDDDADDHGPFIGRCRLDP